MSYSLSAFFSDPVLRGPTIGCVLMCLGASLMGVILFLKKQALVGEALAHASYPGVVLGVLVAGILGVSSENELKLLLFILTGAFCSSLLGLLLIHILNIKGRVSPDAALCFVLSSFFGIGIAIASEIQFSYTSLYKQIFSYLYGQAATMGDLHILIYALLSAWIVASICLFYKELQLILFDRDYAKSLGLPVKAVEAFVFFLVTLALVVGIRSVGVVLISGMLIAPAAAARQFTHRLSLVFVLAGLFGSISGFLGNYFSVQLTDALALLYPGARIILPTGPMIVLTACFIALAALFLAPERGVLLKRMRVFQFRRRRIVENLLKSWWRFPERQAISWRQLAEQQGISHFYLGLILRGMKKKGLIELSLRQGPSYWVQFLRRLGWDGEVRLTPMGEKKAARIVRLHRLWEVYLVNSIGSRIEQVHASAEEMEHILTPELERELTLLLHDPRQDPHHQPIPPREEGAL